MSDDSAFEVPDDSDSVVKSATNAKKRPAATKESRKCAKRAKRAKKSKNDGKKPASRAKARTVVERPETLDCKTIGVASKLGDFLGKSRVQREKSQTAIQETTQAVIENGFMNGGSGGGSGRASSYGGSGDFPTQESLDDVARDFTV
jgi:hypothetical protein